jgi:hypothetical protein
MPWLDGTGPQGRGPATGRGQGRCFPHNFGPFNFGRRFFGGRGSGIGWRNCFGLLRPRTTQNQQQSLDEYRHQLETELEAVKQAQADMAKDS